MEQLTDTLATLSERDRTIAQLQQELTAAGDIARNHPAIAAKDAEIAQLRQQNHELSHQLSEALAKLAELEQRNHDINETKAIIERNAKIQELEQRNHELRVKLNDKLARRAEVERELADRRQFIVRLQEQMRDMVQIKELEKMRDRALASLRLGKQAPGYKAAKQALDEFIDQLQGEEE